MDTTRQTLATTVEQVAGAWEFTFLGSRYVLELHADGNQSHRSARGGGPLSTGVFTFDGDTCLLTDHSGECAAAGTAAYRVHVLAQDGTTIALRFAHADDRCPTRRAALDGQTLTRP